jgi:hypothetical protein
MGSKLLYNVTTKDGRQEHSSNDKPKRTMSFMVRLRELGANADEAVPLPWESMHNINKVNT